MKKKVLSCFFMGIALLLTVVSISGAEEKENVYHHWDAPESNANNESSYTDVTAKEEVYSESDQNYEYTNDPDDMQAYSNESEDNPGQEDAGYKEEEYSEYDEKYEYPDDIQSNPNDSEVKSEPANTDTWNSEEMK